MTTLEELSRKHGTIFIEEKSPGIDRVAFTFDQLRALIEEAVGIVQGDVVKTVIFYDEVGLEHLIHLPKPLHHIDMNKLL